MSFFVYIMTNKNNTVLYTGFTDDVYTRSYMHKQKDYPGSFTAKYNCDKLVYYEEFATADEALHREHQLKRYRRAWKMKLINGFNPEWRDLTEDFEV